MAVGAALKPAVLSLALLHGDTEEKPVWRSSGVWPLWLLCAQGTELG